MLRLVELLLVEHRDRDRHVLQPFLDAAGGDDDVAGLADGIPARPGRRPGAHNTMESMLEAKSKVSRVVEAKKRSPFL